MMKKSHILGCLLLMIAAVSCRYNDKDLDSITPSKVNGGAITFNVGTAKSVSSQTKSVMLQEAPSKVFLGVAEDDSLYLNAVVSDNLDPIPGLTDAPAVKGDMVTDQNLVSFYTMSYFTPQDNEPTRKYFDMTYIDSEDKEGDVYTTDYYWPQESLDFFAVNFKPTLASATLPSMQEKETNPGWVTKSGSVEDYGSISVAWDQPVIYYQYQDNSPFVEFTYALPAPDGENKSDALNQPDYVFAIAKDRVEDDGVVPLNFAHCFSAVTFKLGTQFMSETGRQVKEVKISGVPSSGVCTITPADADSLNFIWDTEGADRLTYCQTVPVAGDDTNIANNTIINSGEMTFMLIPHELSADAKITITVSLHNDRDPFHRHDMVVEVALKDLTPEWEPGKKYTYSISAEETVGVEISDEFISQEPLVKGNLAITNTGAAPIHVRAYIVGRWENEAGDLVSPWTVTNGKFTGTGWANDGFTFNGQGSDWKIGADGFFYYQKVLQPGETAPKIFETYTLTADPPVVGSRLILNIVTQGVLHYYVDDSSVWPGMITMN